MLIAELRIGKNKWLNGKATEKRISVSFELS